MNLLKKILVVFSLIVIGLLGSDKYSNFILAESDDFVLNGVFYDGEIHEVSTQDDLDLSFEINEVTTDNGQLFFSGEVNHNDGTLEVNSNGDIYDSTSMFLKEGNGRTVYFDSEENGNFQILSLTIEENATDYALLPANEDLANKKVIKLAILIPDTNDILYFEDELSNVINFDELDGINLEDELSDLRKSKDDEDEIDESDLIELKNKIEEINATEKWFLNYMEQEAEIEQLDSEDKSGQLDEEYGILIESPVNMISWISFRNEGKRVDQTRSNGGYYMNTVEWPMGSGNYLSDVLSWSYVQSEIDPINVTGNYNTTAENHATLRVLNSEQYLYIDSDFEIVMFDNNVPARIYNPKVGAGITRYSGIFERVETFGYRGEGGIQLNLNNLTGLIPLDRFWSSVKTVIESITRSPAQGSNNVFTYFSTIEQNEEYGDGPVTYFEVSSDSYISDNPNPGETGEPDSENYDRIGLDYRIAIPTDMDGSRTGWKSIRFLYEFEIRTRNAFGFYTVVEDEVSRETIERFEAY